MRRPGVRLAMALVGAGLLGFYLAVGFLIVETTAWLLGRRPEPFDRHLFRVHVRVAQFLLVLLLGLTLALRALAADDRAVEMTGDPLALARALTRIRRASRPGTARSRRCTSTDRRTTS